MINEHAKGARLGAGLLVALLAFGAVACDDDGDELEDEIDQELDDEEDELEDELEEEIND